MVRSLVFVIAFANSFFNVSAQPVADTIATALVRQHLSYLSSDSLKGRGNYTKGLQTAALYIANVYRQEGLNLFPGDSSYFQPFSSLNLTAKDYQADGQGLYNPGKLLLNIIGVLPGKTKPEEVVLFSAHYDHLGTKASGGGDSIYNGANDNASGISGLLSLIHYYSSRQDNARTIIFAAFAGEELGLLGSQAFVRRLLPKAIKAHINIEMIGHSTIGPNAFFVTGADHSNLAFMLAKTLRGSKIKIKSEPDIKQELFRRSDNYPFALQGVPAHSIMCSDDSYLCYHAACDDMSQIDIENMARIIRAVATACQPIIDGKQTPSRIKRIK
ncbi:MAG: Peptidase family [Flaviaesturariibacter sp.]|nr:Peptidase family [Flaviaesturariibacter sp.]